MYMYMYMYMQTVCKCICMYIYICTCICICLHMHVHLQNGGLAFCGRGRLVVAFDATYVTETLSQAEISSQKGLVGGSYNPINPNNAFVSMEKVEDIDVSAVQKSSSMLEFLGWEPSAPKKTPISLLAVPIEVGFGGTHAEQRGSFYMADLVGRFMAESSGIVKALVCDNAGTHKVIRRCLHGQLSPEEEANIADVPWFGKLTHTDVPENCLPRFPMRITYDEEEVVYGIPGVCHLVHLGTVKPFL